MIPIKYKEVLVPIDIKTLRVGDTLRCTKRYFDKAKGCNVIVQSIDTNDVRSVCIDYDSHGGRWVWNHQLVKRFMRVTRVIDFKWVWQIGSKYTCAVGNFWLHAFINPLTHRWSWRISEYENGRVGDISKIMLLGNANSQEEAMHAAECFCSMLCEVRL